MRSLRTTAAALAVALAPWIASAQTPPPRTPEPPAPPRPGMRVPRPPGVPTISVTWFGQAAFVLEAPSGATVLIDPFAEAIGLPVPAEKLPVDAVALTHEHPDHTNVAGFAAGKPEVLRGLAADGSEYAKVDARVKGVRISTVPAFHDDAQGQQRGKDAIFVFDVGSFRIVHLGDFGQAKLTAAQKKALGTVDVLLVPVGGHYTIGPAEAAALAKELAPRRAVIPMHYRLPGLQIAELGPVEPFLEAFPADRVRKVEGPTAEFLPSNRDAPGFEVVVLRPR